MSDFRPRRSMLFMPASNARALEKAKSLPCDGIIFDLEDAVAPDAKADARAQAAAAVASGAYGSRELIVRINGLDSPWWRDDLKAAVAAKPDAILVPKVEDPVAFAQIEEEMAWLGGQQTIQLWVMLETPRGYLRAEALASASDRLSTFVIGTNDLVKDLHARHVPGRAPVMAALSGALMVARAHGLNILDGVYGNFRDEAGFEAECIQGRDMGFDGKTLIHPAQIDCANRIFGPDAAALADARAMIAAFEEAQAAGKGVAVLDGRMIEDLHVLEAKRLVAMAEAIAGQGLAP